MLDSIKQILNTKNKNRTQARALAKIEDYLTHNDFEIYSTFTLDPRRLTNYTQQNATSAMRKWLLRQHRLSRDAGLDFKYIMVPDSYQDAKILRFHVLMSGHTFSLKDTRIVLNHTVAYRIPQFRLGFTTVVDVSQASKEQLLDTILSHIESAPPTLPFSHRYFASRTLDSSDDITLKLQAGRAQKQLYPSSTLYDPSTNPTLPL